MGVDGSVVGATGMLEEDVGPGSLKLDSESEWWDKKVGRVSVVGGSVETDSEFIMSGSTTSLVGAVPKKLVSFRIFLAVFTSSFSFSRFLLAALGMMILTRPFDWISWICSNYYYSEEQHYSKGLKNNTPGAMRRRTIYSLMGIINCDF